MVMIAALCRYRDCHISSCTKWICLSGRHKCIFVSWQCPQSHLYMTQTLLSIPRKHFFKIFEKKFHDSMKNDEDNIGLYLLHSSKNPIYIFILLGEINFLCVHFKQLWCSQASNFLETYGNVWFTSFYLYLQVCILSVNSKVEIQITAQKMIVYPYSHRYVWMHTMTYKPLSVFAPQCSCS